MSANLTAKTLHGLKWSYAGAGVNSLLQLGFTALMARLLAPEAFGLMAMAGLVLRFGSYLAQMGVGSALVQKLELDGGDVRAAFTSSLGLGALFAGLTWVLAPLSVHVFANPDVVPVVRVLGLSFALGGASATALNLLRRELRFRAIAVVETVSYAVGYGVVGVGMALSGRGVWSLVGASLAQGAVTAVLALAVKRHDLRPSADWARYRALYSFGGRVSLIGFLEFLGSNLDTLAIGRLGGAAPLGLYNRAFLLVNLPMQNLTTSLSRVLFPSLSRLQAERERLRRVYLAALMLLSAFLVPTCLGIMGASRDIVLLILGPKWAEAVPVLAILALATPLNLLSHLGGVTCEATATLNPKIAIQVASTLVLAALLFLLRGFGVSGFALAVVAAEAVRHAAYVLVMRRTLAAEAPELLAAYVPGLASGLVAGTAIAAVSAGLWQTTLPVAARFAADVLTGVAALGASLFLPTHRPVRIELRERWQSFRAGASGTGAARMLTGLLRALPADR